MSAYKAANRRPVQRISLHRAVRDVGRSVWGRGPRRNIGRGLSLILSVIIGQLSFAAMSRCNGQSYKLYCVSSDEAGGGDGAISPDGKSFVCSSRRSGSFQLWLCDIDSGGWERLTNSKGDDTEPQWSPDGSHVVFTSTRSGRKEIWTMSVRDGALRQLTYNSDDAEYPCWSPDGNLIAYTEGPWERRDFFTVSPRGGGSKKVTQRSGAYGACSFFPDSQRLVYHAYDSGSGNVSVLDLRNGQSTPLTMTAAWDYKPTVSPNEEWIAFSRSAETLASRAPSSIWLIRPDLKRGGPLTNSLGTDRWPNWDKTSSKLFFHRIVDVGNAIKLLDRQTGIVRTLVDGNDSLGPASFDPRSRRVVYSAHQGNGYVLRLLDLDTNETHTLNTGNGSAVYPRWSPDGKRIAYASDEDGRWNICTCNTSGFDRVNWTTSLRDVHGMNGPVDWSPDSTRIVFHGDTKPYEANIFLVDTRDGSIRNLTHDEWYSEAPSWSPDGRAVIFLSTRGGAWSWGFFRLDIDTEKIEAVVAPDSVEKNFPRITCAGSLIFSMYDTRGTEYLAEFTGSGPIRKLEGSEDWARWPSCTADGRFILYTTITHRTEYWVADGLGTTDSPFLSANSNIRSSLLPQGLSSANGGPTSAHSEKRTPVHFIRRCLPAPGWREFEPHISSSVPAHINQP
jgi:TolB protein